MLCDRHRRRHHTHRHHHHLHHHNHHVTWRQYVLWTSENIERQREPTQTAPNIINQNTVTHCVVQQTQAAPNIHQASNNTHHDEPNHDFEGFDQNARGAGYSSDAEVLPVADDEGGLQSPAVVVLRSMKYLGKPEAVNMRCG